MRRNATGRDAIFNRTLGACEAARKDNDGRKQEWHISPVMRGWRVETRRPVGAPALHQRALRIASDPGHNIGSSGAKVNVLMKAT